MLNFCSGCLNVVLDLGLFGARGAVNDCARQLQALMDALATFCDTLHMQVSVVKTKVMLVSPDPAAPVTFTCNGQHVDHGSKGAGF